MQHNNRQSFGYKTILLRAVDEASLSRTLATAIDFAHAYATHIIGIAALPRTLLVPGGTPGVPDVVRLDGRRRAAETECARMFSHFRRVCLAEALTADWIVADRDDQAACDKAARITRTADLIVAPTLPRAFSLASDEQDAADLLLASGRPLLLLPRGAAMRARPGRILIAWNASREAARAVFDALPLLRTASVVTVTSVTARRSRTSASAAELALCLQRHGVPALINEIDVPVQDAGGALLAAAKADSAELMVMGGYGRSRFAERMLGGTTRHVLHQAHLPIFVSH